MDARDARASGAGLPPRVGDWTPGGINTLRGALKTFKSGYPGDRWDDITARVGNTFNLRIFIRESGELRASL